VSLAKKAARDWAMTSSSKRSEQKENEMRFFLKRAVRELNGLEEQESPLAAA